MNKFARLEEHNGLQVLARISAENRDGKYGPCLITCCDTGMLVEFCYGPFSDDDEGWIQAEDALESIDLAKVAEEAAGHHARIYSI